MSAKLGLLTAIWGRPRLTELVLEYYYRRVEYGCVVNSPEDESSIGLPYRGFWDSVSFSNSPLSDKWIRGVNWISLNQPVDAVIIVGSDDLITPKYIEACRYLIENGADYIYLPGSYFYDTQTGRMIWGYAERLGMGRCISRRLLDRLDWKPWPEGLEYGLDGAMWERVKELDDVNIVCLKDALKHGYVGMDIKTGENMWSFDHIREMVISADVEAESILRKYFPSVADELLNWENDEITR